jgi:hypothetical protein
MAGPFACAAVEDRHRVSRLDRGRSRLREKLARCRLKDLSRPERIYQVEAAFLAEQAAGQRAIGHKS